MSFLSPAILVNNIDLISLLMGVVLLIIFSSWVNRKVVFPILDKVKRETHKQLKKHHKQKNVTKYISEFFATLIFLFYCYVGASFTAEFLFKPFLISFQNYILIVFLIMFLAVSWAVNSRKFRNQYF